MRRNRKAVSSVIGAAIALAIFFTVIVPFWLYMQNVQTLYMREASRRLQFELDRLNEKLEIHISLTPPDAFGRSMLYMILHNPGPLSVTIPTVYIESQLAGLQEKDLNLMLAPGETVTMPLDFIVEATDKVIVRAVTMRGNSFIAPEYELGPANLPYFMVVSISNMSQNYRYLVKVDVEGDYGCVSAEAGEFAQGCKGEAEEWRRAETFTDQEALAVFMIAPGSYIVRLYRYQWTGSQWGGAVLIETLRVDATKHVALRFHLPKPTPPSPIPLRVYVPEPNTVQVLQQRVGNIMRIPFQLSLGNESEPLREITVEMSLTYEDLIALPVSQEIVISRLAPGETYSGYFTITVDDDSSYPQKYGGKIYYIITVNSAIGEDTGTHYSSNDFAQSQIDNLEITFCRITNAKVKVYISGSWVTRTVKLLMCGNKD